MRVYKRGRDASFCDGAYVYAVYKYFMKIKLKYEYLSAIVF